jgi:hypothetical protein
LVKVPLRRHTRPLKLLNLAFEPERVHFSETLDQPTRQYAADQNFCWFVQITATLFFKTSRLQVVFGGFIALKDHAYTSALALETLPIMAL